MATATAKAGRASVADVIDLGHALLVRGNIVWSAAADTYATGGVALSFDLIPGFEKVSTAKPLFIHVYSNVNSYGYRYDYSTGKLLIYTTMSHGTEKTNSEALQTTVVVTTDNPYYFAIFKKTP